MNIQLIASPVIGAVIGYITNDIAIKMLFHPHEAKYIGKFRIPFTPGLIPKEKNRIAKSLGSAISQQLLNKEVLEAALLSDEMLDRLSGGIDNIIEKNRTNETTVNETLLKIMPEESLEALKGNISEGITGAVMRLIEKEDVGHKAASALLDYAKEQIQGTILSMFSSMLDEGMANKIADMINDMLREKAGDYIKEYSDKGVEKVADKKICELINGNEDKVGEIKELIVNGYKKIIGSNLQRILKTINIGSIVEERISGFDVAELEALIFGIMKKELNMIVYLGAILGLLMGCVNGVISLL
jgi:uncharacterized membrane protein YheB (UPF0754 family)